MDFKKAITGAAGAVGGAVGQLLGVGQGGPDEERQAAIAKLLANGGAGMEDRPARAAFELPGLDDTLNEEALKRKAAAEAAGEPFEPSETDYTDAGPFGYLHKKKIHDALVEYQREIEANAPQVDYQGILRQRLADIAQMPEEHRTNPLTLFAMAMGDPKNAQELIGTYNKGETEANEKQTQRWQELLDMKQQALEGSVKQALAAGEQRKVVSGKWLEALAQIEQDKARLSGELQKNKEKAEAAARRAVLRGEWALKAVQARSQAMAASVGMKVDSAEFRSLQSNAAALAKQLIKNGAEPEDAYDQAEEWVANQLSVRSTSGAGVGGGGGTAQAAPASPGRAVGTGTGNPLEERIKANRAKGAQAPPAQQTP